MNLDQLLLEQWNWMITLVVLLFNTEKYVNSFLVLGQLFNVALHLTPGMFWAKTPNQRCKNYSSVAKFERCLYMCQMNLHTEFQLPTSF